MILLTGGMGYVGSHVCIALMSSGYDVLILDNLSNSDVRVLDQIEKIHGSRPAFVEGDIRDKDLLSRLFETCKITAVMHFAGLKAVGESVANPMSYYENNVVGTYVLLEAMVKAGVGRLVFSSSATVYSPSSLMPVDEEAVLSASSPYGRTKLIVEEMLADMHGAKPDLSVVCLRYFNPVGAHESGLIGELPSGVPNNLMPYLCQVAAGVREQLRIFGADYPTPDGTGVRDFIHVVDLAQGHVDALRYCERNAVFTSINLGTGSGHSVFDLVREFESVTGRSVPYEVVGRRDGDVAECWANPEKARQLLGWQAKRNLRQMCEDSWRWQVHLNGGVA
ncbi:UDP-glucose 4-epimerase GalE [Pseudoxanthomonas sp.]|uniref:UDP-glucose 4-epimerase GalE n=1 Tax=Pseudoxanthomonas sp. TaxID=1871049 RepID=UPI0028C46E6A|nr:UDP-glucose 4-epimerase GalE [Pseudoxanthomonas sp.]